MHVECEGQLGESTLDACHHRRTGKSKLRFVCGNDGSEDLPHPHKTIIVLASFLLLLLLGMKAKNAMFSDDLTSQYYI